MTMLAPAESAVLDVGSVQSNGPAQECRVSAMVGPEAVFFDSDLPLRESPEAFLSAFLIPAMRAGCDLRSSDAVCETWAGHAEEAHAIAHRYWGFEGGAILADRTAVPPLSTDTGVFFSGGVDSFYSLLSNRDVVTALIFVHGFDIPLTDLERFAATSELLGNVARALDLRVITVRTNLRGHPVFRSASWADFTYGAALGAVAQVLAPQLGHVLVASSDVKPPHGSSEELDRCWSSAAVAVTNDGSSRSRLDKVAAIAGEPLVHRHLRVCWENRSEALNCGVCEKCVRTQLQFAAAGTLNQLTCFGAIDLPARIDALPFIPSHLEKQWVDAERVLGQSRIRQSVKALRRRTRRHRARAEVERIVNGVRHRLTRGLGLARGP